MHTTFSPSSNNDKPESLLSKPGAEGQVHAGQHDVDGRIGRSPLKIHTRFVEGHGNLAWAMVIVIAAALVMVLEGAGLSQVAARDCPEATEQQSDRLEPRVINQGAGVAMVGEVGVGVAVSWGDGHDGLLHGRDDILAHRLSTLTCRGPSPSSMAGQDFGSVQATQCNACGAANLEDETVCVLGGQVQFPLHVAKRVADMLGWELRNLD